MEAIEPLIKPHSLRLWANKLTRLPAKVIESIFLPKKLNLADNEISSIKTSELDCLRKLEALDLSTNTPFGSKDKSRIDNLNVPEFSDFDF